MPRTLPSLELIRGFEAAARLSSFTRAAASASNCSDWLAARWSS